MKVVTIHGIRMKNRWFESLAETEKAKTYHLEFYNFDFGYFSFLKFIRKKEREKVITNFCNFYSENFTSEERPCAIAHSFGTYVIFQAMRKFVEIKFDKIVFCGSILGSTLNWRQAFERKQLFKLKNDHGELEWFLKHTRWLIDSDCGNAGEVGFQDIPPKYKAAIINSNGYVRHSDYFLPIHMNENWLGFISEGLQKLEYNTEILTNTIIERIYKNQANINEIFRITEISFNARIDYQGNYYAKYIKKGINETANIIDTSYFTTTADGIHPATDMNFSAYTLDNKKLHHTIYKDVNHQKTFKISLSKPVEKHQSMDVKYFFCWYKTMNMNGDTDHWTITGISNVAFFLNFPQEPINPRLFLVKNKAVVEQLIMTKKMERDSTVSYHHQFNNKEGNDGLIFYFEGLDKNNIANKKSREVEFRGKGRKDKFIIAKASESDIKKIYKIEVEVESINAANEEVLELRRLMFNDGFLVAKKKGQVVGYLESVVWNEKQIEKFDEISNFPHQYNINGHELYVIFVAVDKAFRKRGIAKHLLNEIESVARENKLKKITLVAKSNLVAMYINLGFTQVKELPLFLNNRDTHSVLMEKYLN